MTCANCGCEITPGSDYLEVCDNFLQVKYFDSPEEAIFCSEECLHKALTIETKTMEG